MRKHLQGLGRKGMASGCMWDLTRRFTWRDWKSPSKHFYMARFTIYHVNRVYMVRLYGLHGGIHGLHGGIDMSPCKLVYMGKESHHVNSIYMEELGFHHVNMLLLIYKGVLQIRHVDRIYMVLLCMHTFVHTYICMCTYIQTYRDIYIYMHTSIRIHIHTYEHAYIEQRDDELLIRTSGYDQVFRT